MLVSLVCLLKVYLGKQLLMEKNVDSMFTQAVLRCWTCYWGPGAQSRNLHHSAAQSGSEFSALTAQFSWSLSSLIWVQGLC